MDNSLPQKHYLQQEEIYLSFVNQLKKDAGMSNIEISDSILSHNLSEMIINLHHHIQNILQKNNGFEKIQSWLYRVDISEKTIKEKMNTANKSYSEIISELIIKRTLQKVILRHLYKNKK